MPETKVTLPGIDKLEVKGRIVEVKLDDEESEKRLYTDVKFTYEGAPGKLDQILAALTCEHRVDVTLSSPQGSLGIDSVTISSCGQSVTLGKEE
jgi:hypothetical protein